MKIRWKLRSQWILTFFHLNQFCMILLNGPNTSIDIFSNSVLFIFCLLCKLGHALKFSKKKCFLILHIVIGACMEEHILSEIAYELVKYLKMAEWRKGRQIIFSHYWSTLFFVWFRNLVMSWDFLKIRFVNTSLC